MIMEATDQEPVKVVVLEMMHLLDHHHHFQFQTLKQIYHNFTSTHKATIFLLQTLKEKFPTYRGNWYVELEKQIGIFITFARCSMKCLTQENDSIDKSLVTLLKDIERHLMDVVKDCTHQLSCEELCFDELQCLEEYRIEILVPRIAKVYLRIFQKIDSGLIGDDDDDDDDEIMLIELVDQVVEDFDLDLCWVVLVEKLSFLKNYVLLCKEQMDGKERRRELLVYVQVVAHKMACYSFFRKFERYVSEEMQSMISDRIKPEVCVEIVKSLVLTSCSVPCMTAEFLTEYVNCIREYLMEMLKDEDAIDLTVGDQLYTLHDGLQFSTRLLTSFSPNHNGEGEKLLAMRMRFQALVRKVGFVVYSCFNDQTKRSSITIDELSDSIEKVKHIKEDIIEVVSCVILHGTGSESPRLEHNMGFFILLLQNMVDLMNLKSDLILKWKDKYNTMDKDIYLLRSFLNSTERNSPTDGGSENIEDLDDHEMNKQLKILIEKLRCLRRCLGLDLDQIKGEELEELLISTQVVAFKMACYSSWRKIGEFCWWEAYSSAKRRVDSHVRYRILRASVLSLDDSSNIPLTDKLLIACVDCVQDSLIWLVKNEHIHPMSDQFGDGLSLLVLLLFSFPHEDCSFQEKLSDIKVRFRATVTNIGFVICSFFSNSGVEESMGSNGLADLLEKLNLIKDEVMEIHSIVILDKIGRESPKTDRLGFLNRLLDNWKELLDCESELIIVWLDQFQSIHENLHFFRSFIHNVTSNSTGDDELQNLSNHIMEAGYKAEYLLNSFAHGACPVWCTALWISKLTENMEHIKTVVMGFNKEKAPMVPNIDASKGPTYEHSQALVVPTLTDMVGFSVEMKLIMERLSSNLKHQDVVSIIGMPGLGKTTLARKVYEDPFTVNYFDVRTWCCVSHEYNKKELFLTILGSIIELTDLIRRMCETDLSVMVHKQLTRRRYFIVLDDIWEIDAFMNLKRFFPDDRNGSRIMLTSRSKVIGLQSKCHSDPIELGFLTDEESWDLFERKVFHHEGKCPPELRQIGKQITQKCKGLPLAVVLVAGLVAKSDKKQYFLEQIAENLSSYVDHDSQSQWKAALELSYKFLPDTLKPLFLYLGVFPEDKEIPTDTLIWLWISEGLVDKTEIKSLKIQAEVNLMGLIDRSLVMVARRRSNGTVKSCVVHDLLRDMCLEKAKDENFMHQIQAYNELTDPIIYQQRLSILSQTSPPTSSRPLVTHKYLPMLSITPPLYTLLFFDMHKSLPMPKEAIESVFSCFKLLRVLHSESTTIDTCAYNVIIMLVYLRYMSIRISFNSIPSSISNLRNLETLNIKGVRGEIVVPQTIWEMVKLRHLHINDRAMFSATADNFSILENLENLSTPAISLEEDNKYLIGKVPNLHKLRCILIEGSNYSNRNGYGFPNLESLGKLESLKMLYYGGMKCSCQFKLPTHIKKLSLSKFRLKWSEISMLQELKKLEVLKLRSGAVQDEFWDTVDEDEFPSLKLLKLENLNIKRWNACAENFPSLEKLVLERCKQLEEIPSSLGDIDSLQMIEVLWCGRSAAQSAKEFQEEQENMGNELLKVHIYPPQVI